MVSLADRYQLLYFEIHGVIHAEITFLLECSLALTDSGEGSRARPFMRSAGLLLWASLPGASPLA